MIEELTGLADKHGVSVELVRAHHSQIKKELRKTMKVGTPAFYAELRKRLSDKLDVLSELSAIENTTVKLKVKKSGRKSKKTT